MKMEGQEPVWQSRWWQTGKGSEQVKLRGLGSEEDRTAAPAGHVAPAASGLRSLPTVPYIQVANEPFYR